MRSACKMSSYCSRTLGAASLINVVRKSISSSELFSFGRLLCSASCQCNINKFSVIHDYLCTKANPNDCGRRFDEHAHKLILRPLENREGTPKQPRSPVCGRLHLQNLSTHLHSKPPSAITEKPGEKRVSQCEHSPPTKRPRTKACTTTSLVTKPYSQFIFRHKFSLLVVGPSVKTYFVQQILKHNCLVYEKQKTIRIFWYYNQWQECYEDLKTSLEKSIRFERGVPEQSENLCEINPRYNNIIILDDLMAETTDSPVVSRLFTQGRHRNASVILLLQNMFPKGKYNTDIS